MSKKKSGSYLEDSPSYDLYEGSHGFIIGEGVRFMDNAPGRDDDVATYAPSNGTSSPSFDSTFAPTYEIDYTLAPFNGTLAPFNETLAPFNGTLAPFNGTLAPFNETLAPFNGTLAPFNGTLSPIGLRNQPGTDPVLGRDATVGLVAAGAFVGCVIGGFIAKKLHNSYKKNNTVFSAGAGPELV